MHIVMMNWQRSEGRNETDENRIPGPGADDVIKLFETEARKIKYVGTATCDFQAQPFLYGLDGRPIISSDWEMHEMRAVNEGRENIYEMPRFLDNPELYMRRAEALGLNMFRFSLDFARLCPNEGEFDKNMMGRYVRALALIKAHGMEPMLCIYHWPMPRYLLRVNRNGEIEAGGWENPQVQRHFRFYVEQVVRYLGDESKIRPILAEAGFDHNSQDKIIEEGLVQYFLTINEPTNIIGPGYLFGMFPPYKRGAIRKALQVLEQLATAHRTAEEELRNLGRQQIRQPMVAATHNWSYIEGPLGSGTLLNEAVNYAPTSYIEGRARSDYLALQYYHRLQLPFIHGVPKFLEKLGSPDHRVFSDMPDFGDIYPLGIYRVLKEMDRRYPGIPVIITEMGFADTTDRLRPFWLIETARYAMQAAQVRGMLQWTLVNNLEWALGMKVPFGMFSERELSQPLIPSQEGSIRSWEVWRAIAGVCCSQDPESRQHRLAELGRVYQIAQTQYLEELERRKNASAR